MTVKIMEFTSLNEILTFAVRQEELACQLYADAAAKATDASARKMFQEIAAEEADHRDHFSRIDASLLQQGSVGREPHHLALRELRPNASYPEILLFAIEAEESAGNLYEAAAVMTDDPKIKRMLLVLAEVERGHKKRVAQIYEECVLTDCRSLLRAPKERVSR